MVCVRFAIFLPLCEFSARGVVGKRRLAEGASGWRFHRQVATKGHCPEATEATNKTKGQEYVNPALLHYKGSIFLNLFF